MSSAPPPIVLPDCDLIMKGGITSGIVYPAAILRLKDRYRFRNIGGASAGAIASAFAAAAEFAREADGFRKLEQRCALLAQGAFLKNLFQPSERTRPLLDVAYGLMVIKTNLEKARKDGRLRPGITGLLRLTVPSLLALVQRTSDAGSGAGARIGTLIAAVLSILSALIFAAATGLLGRPVAWADLGFGTFLLFLILLFIWVPIGAFVGGVTGLWRRFSGDVPDNFFGICNGRPGVVDGGPTPVLTDWIDESIQDLAGRPGGRPVTFGDLAGKGVRLSMMTTNLSHNQGYQLPGLAADGDDDLSCAQEVFAFCAGEFERLFPKAVVAAMTPESARTLGGLALPAGYYAFPRGADLPVVVATRMSLSFPVLLSAVPLYTVRRSAADRLRQQPGGVLTIEDLQRNWFSDGGISSNFPIHFFDNWLPACPTFGILLTDLPADGFEPDPSAGFDRVSNRFVSATQESRKTSPSARVSAGLASSPDTDEARTAERAVEKAVYLPRGNDLVEPAWRPIQDWGAFAGAIFTTLHDAHDNMQSALPGFRERIVQVRLSSDEGGLNLAMPEHTIEQVMAKGDKAGEKILRYFNLDEHRWIRFRVLMAELERNFAVMEQRLEQREFDVVALCASESAKESSRVSDPTAVFPYPRDAAWCENALARVRGLRQLSSEWEASVLFGEDVPAPRPVLRVVPRA
ncbi:MAG: hypothetical protein ABJD11_16100 [Gemmatimonadota bacterium]